MPLDTEDWCKIWTNNDLFFKIDKNLVNFDPGTQVSKICTLIGPFSAKYIIFDLKIYSGVIFHHTEE